jgi:choline-phosphate cytidylyltransferase
VRDYDQYIDRQLKRGTSRRELNVSWLKKNELDFKRNMAEFRDSIKANWATTGQELSKDIRQFWQSSRPASPARTPTREVADQLDAHGATARSPSALSRLSHLDIPGRSGGARESSDFAAGYNLGLIGGVRSWVRSKVEHLETRGSHANSVTDGPQSSQLERQQASKPT